MKTSHLVAYDYGQGAVWAVIVAESASQIEQDFPELTIVRDRPTWLTYDELLKIEAVHRYDVGDRTIGLLAEIILAREDHG